MTLKLLLGALVGTVVLMIWGTVYWTGMAFNGRTLTDLPNGEQIAATLKQSGARSGTYLWPAPPTSSDPANRLAFKDKHLAGPLMMVSYRADGVDPMSAGVMGMGIVHYFISALLVALLMRLAMPGLRSYIRRAGFVALAGIFAGFMADLSGPIWFHVPADFPLLNFVYHVVAWVLAGLAMAAIIKPPRAAGMPVPVATREHAPATTAN